MIRTLLTNSNVAVILMHRFSQQTVDGFVTWIEQKQVVLIVGRDVYADDARLASDNEIDDSALRVEELQTVYRGLEMIMHQRKNQTCVIREAQPVEVEENLC